MDIKELREHAKNLKVLYVEDNKDARESTLMLLDNFFDNIIVAVDGQDGLDKYTQYFEENNSYVDIVISDITMPNLNGIEMSKLIKKKYNKQHILIISAHDDSERLQEILNIGITTYVHKPIEINNLLEKLTIILNEIKSSVEQKEEFNDIQSLNKELDAIVGSFDKYVIASRTDLKGNITYASKAYENISGYTSEELLNRPHNIVRHPDMPKEAFKDLWETIKNGNLWEGEVKNLKKNGDFYWVKALIAPYYDANGKHIGYSAIRQDITAQKKVEELQQQMQEINNDLEKQVMERIAEVCTLNQEIKDTQKEVVFRMGAIGERRSQETGNHVKRVAEYSKILALKYGLDEKEADMLKEASPMHDIGKVAIPDAILNKPGTFDEEERKIMSTHAELGYEILCSSSRPLLKMAATVAYEHHEKYDGSGYPRGLKGEDISIHGRISALADVFDALGSSRVYKPSWEDEKIFAMIKEERGRHFDPKLVDIFFENLDQILTVRDSLR